jgi:hypothetical protein
MSIPSPTPVDGGSAKIVSYGGWYGNPTSYPMTWDVNQYDMFNNLIGSPTSSVGFAVNTNVASGADHAIYGYTIMGVNSHGTSATGHVGNFTVNKGTSTTPHP